MGPTLCQQVIARLPIVRAPMKWETNAMDNSLKDEIDDRGSLLNQAKARPFSVMVKALHLTGS